MWSDSAQDEEKKSRHGFVCLPSELAAATHPGDSGEACAYWLSKHRSCGCNAGDLSAKFYSRSITTHACQSPHQIILGRGGKELLLVGRELRPRHTVCSAGHFDIIIIIIIIVKCHGPCRLAFARRLHDGV